MWFILGVKVCKNRLGDVQTCRITLALAYVLHCLSAAWSQFQIIRKSLR